MRNEVSFIGYGEAAQAFASSSDWCGFVAAYDVLVHLPEWASVLRQHCDAHGVTLHQTNADAARNSPVIISLVTADQALTAADVTAAHISPGALYLDMNSVSPKKKLSAANLINNAGGVYVDVAIMAPVLPRSLNVPVLVSGDIAAQAKSQLEVLGFSEVTIAGDKIGDASSVKMMRSILIKGVEALTAECFLAAQNAGLIEAVISALGEEWGDRANYNLERMLTHGRRRGAEMDEVCETLASLGIAPIMSHAATVWQKKLGALDHEGAKGSLKDQLGFISDTIEVREQ